MVNVDSKIDKILNSNSQPMTEMASYSRSNSYSRSDNARPTVPPAPKRRSSAQDCSYYEAYDYERFNFYNGYQNNLLFKAKRWCIQA